MVLLEEMHAEGIDAIVFSSTAAVYGEPETVPITEDAPKQPINAYGASKLCFENVLEWMAATRGLRSVRFRYFNVAGAWPDASLGEAHDPETHIIPRLLKACAAGRNEFEVYGGRLPDAGRNVRQGLSARLRPGKRTSAGAGGFGKGRGGWAVQPRKRKRVQQS